MSLNLGCHWECCVFLKAVDNLQVLIKTYFYSDQQLIRRMYLKGNCCVQEVSYFKISILPILPSTPHYSISAWWVCPWWHSGQCPASCAQCHLKCDGASGCVIWIKKVYGVLISHVYFIVIWGFLFLGIFKEIRRKHLEIRIMGFTKYNYIEMCDT